MCLVLVLQHPIGVLVSRDSGGVPVCCQGLRSGHEVRAGGPGSGFENLDIEFLVRVIIFGTQWLGPRFNLCIWVEGYGWKASLGLGSLEWHL